MGVGQLAHPFFLSGATMPEPIFVNAQTVPPVIAANGGKSVAKYKEKLLLIGQQFTRLHIDQVEVVITGKAAAYFAHCSCDCGQTARVNVKSLLSGLTKSCGCLQRENKGRPIDSGVWAKGNELIALEYNRLKNFNQRCHDPKHKHYADYGGRGIKVCDRWNLQKTPAAIAAANFMVDMGPRPSPQHSIDRKENNGDYTPDNCEWQTKLRQANNTRCHDPHYVHGNTQIFTYEGVSYGKLALAAQLSDEFGLSRYRIAAIIRSPDFRIEKVLECMTLLHIEVEQQRTYLDAQPLREKTYKHLWSIHERCTNPNHPKHSRYAALGLHPRYNIKLAGAATAINNLLEDIGPSPAPHSRYSIDRIRNAEGYVPGNLRWATRQEQANNRNCNVLYAYNGKELTRSQLAHVLAAEYQHPVKPIIARLAATGCNARQAVAWLMVERGCTAPRAV